MYNKSNDLNFREKIEALKLSVEPKYLLESLGFKIENENSKELRCRCIIHGGDNKTAFRFNIEKRTWSCYSHHCHEIYGYDMISLVMGVLKINFKEAVEYLQSISSNEVDLYEYKHTQEKNKFISENNKEIIINENSLLCYKGLRSTHFNKNGFSNEILNHFEVGGGYTDKNGIIRDVIPIRNDKGELVAYSFRDIRDFNVDNKYINTSNFDKNKVLYNFFNVIKNNINKPIILVEGYKSVWKLYEYGIYNVVAVMGSVLTEGQSNLLCKYALNRVIIAFDNDLPGVVGTLYSYKLLNKKINVTPIFLSSTNLKIGDSPAEFNKDEAYKYLEY